MEMFWKAKPKTRLQELREKRDQLQKEADAEHVRLSSLYEKAVSEKGKASFDAESLHREMGQNHWEYSLELDWRDDVLLVEEIRELGGFFESHRERVDYWAEDPDGRETLSVLGRVEARRQLAQLKLIESEQRNAARATQVSTAALWVAGASIVLNPIAARLITYYWP